MGCSVPICVLIHRTMADGSDGLLMAPDLATALTDAAGAKGAWTARSITSGSEILLEGEALARAIRDAQRLWRPRL